MHSVDSLFWYVAEALTSEAHGGSSVYVSHFPAQEHRDRLPFSQSAVIPYGVAIPGGQASFAADPIQVVYSGRLVIRQKCIHQVVATLISACGSHPSPRPEALPIGGAASSN